VAHAEGKLARLKGQAEAMQAELVRLQQAVARAQRRLDDSQVARLVDVNAQLVVAALASQAEAEAAARALENAARLPVLDALTQLPNRSTLRDRFAQASANAKRHGGRLALLFLDLDNFKQINDTHGHAFGDRVLRSVAERLGSAVRGVDTVSRHGGDEFVILLAELTQPSDAQAVAEKLIAATAALGEVDGRIVSVTASVGIALYPDDGEDVDALVARADAAMYGTKRLRAGGLAFHREGP
jgi:diguanylate cyclase (GGDEF)-like protein